ncbi:MAG: 50S ribosomal protein L28 [Patescibacteria group bacterium]
MSYICEICGKGIVVGRSQRHKRGVAGKRWKKRAPSTKRLFKPNLQKATLIISGKKAKMNVCAKCLKKIKKTGSVGDYSNIAVG